MSSWEYQANERLRLLGEAYQHGRLSQHEYRLRRRTFLDELRHRSEEVTTHRNAIAGAGQAREVGVVDERRPDQRNWLRWVLIAVAMLLAMLAGMQLARAAVIEDTTEQATRLPPVAERDRPGAPLQLEVRGFRVTGVGDHVDDGITPDAVQAEADQQFKKLADGKSQVSLSFDQLQAVADHLTQLYRLAGYIVSTAYLPAQTPGPDRLIEIHVLEGRVGDVQVQGNHHYHARTISAPFDGLREQPLRKRDVDQALLYDRDLPAVAVSAVLQPGKKVGETDVQLVATESRPYRFSFAASNYGTEQTGRERLQVGFAWFNPLGFGDALNLNYVYALNPRQSRQGSASYRIPIRAVSGLSVAAGYERGELQVRNGEFASLGLEGPTKLGYLGADWKFINRQYLQAQATLRYLRERSQLEIWGTQLSDHQFDAAELGFTVRQTDLRWRGVNLLQTTLRSAVKDRSTEPDYVAPDHEPNFLVFRLGYTRMQALTRTQRLYLKVNGQYTQDALAPLEQFAIGGADSVRAFPLDDALGDRGYYSALEYHVDAPGFADHVSPFNGRSWRELLEMELFFDHARTYRIGSNAGTDADITTFDGVGAGLTFRLPWHGFEARMTASVPVGGTRPSDDDDLRIYGRIAMTF